MACTLPFLFSVLEHAADLKCMMQGSGHKSEGALDQALL